MITQLTRVSVEEIKKRRNDITVGCECVRCTNITQSTPQQSVIASSEDSNTDSTEDDSYSESDNVEIEIVFTSMDLEYITTLDVV